MFSYRGSYVIDDSSDQILFSPPTEVRSKDVWENKVKYLTLV